VTPLPLLALAYLIGSIPTSYWLGKGIYGVDLRQKGSGNLGATNAVRVLGWKVGPPVMIVDVAKGWMPTWLFPQIDGEAAMGWALAYGAAAVLGHVFSFWVGFRGGKGIATSAGIFIALAPWAILIGFVVWAGTLLLSRMVSLASILAAAALPVAVLLTAPERVILFWFTLALAAFVIWAHRANISRILSGSESRVGRRGPDRPEPGNAAP
jgi:acyl phosphate:glycerol-3-phosphate acyltransferase